MTASLDEFRQRARPPATRVNDLRGMAQEAPRMAALTGSAGQQQGSGQPSGPAPGQQQAAAPTMLGKGEMADESLPGAGGGANPGPQLQ